MRSVVLMVLMILAGCSAAREAAGQIQTVAEKGIGIQPAAATEAAAPANDTPASDKPAALPAGLGGDSDHPAYAPPPPR